jgi:hypothetical protein
MQRKELGPSFQVVRTTCTRQRLHAEGYSQVESLGRCSFVEECRMSIWPIGIEADFCGRPRVKDPTEVMNDVAAGLPA